MLEEMVQQEQQLLYLILVDFLYQVLVIMELLELEEEEVVVVEVVDVVQAGKMKVEMEDKVVVVVVVVVVLVLVVKEEVLLFQFFYGTILVGLLIKQCFQLELQQQVVQEGLEGLEDQVEED